MSAGRMPGARLVWNKGIAAQCDWRIPDEFTVSGEYRPAPLLAGADITFRSPNNLIADPAVYSEIREGELVWVRLAWMRSFRRQVLPRIRTRFVLVTGDSDSPVPSAMKWSARRFLADARLLCWYAQNLRLPEFVEEAAPAADRNRFP